MALIAKKPRQQQDRQAAWCGPTQCLYLRTPPEVRTRFGNHASAPLDCQLQDCPTDGYIRVFEIVQARIAGICDRNPSMLGSRVVA